MLGLLSAHISRLGPSADCQSTDESDMSALESLGRLFSFYFSSRSALQKSCAAYVVSEWATVTSVSALSRCTRDLLIPVIIARLSAICQSGLYADVMRFATVEWNRPVERYSFTSLSVSQWTINDNLEVHSRKYSFVKNRTAGVKIIVLQHCQCSQSEQALSTILRDLIHCAKYEALYITCYSVHNVQAPGIIDATNADGGLIRGMWLLETCMEIVDELWWRKVDVCGAVQ